MAKVNTESTLIDRLLSRGVSEVVEKDHLRAALLSGKQLRIKFGIDPTAPDLHLGHTVPLRKLREFQDLGHQAVLVIGDFTARIGDPTGRSVERKMLGADEIKRNVKTYLKQAGAVLNLKKLEIQYNNTWFKKDMLPQLLALAQAGSIQQVLHRADFKKRLAEGSDISLLETLYPLFQGYDSVMIDADVELGGTDQTFNLLMGRRVQRSFNKPEQDIMTVPLLEGTDGVAKMSKSAGNYIAITDAPSEMYGKVMSIKDELIEKYFLLCTNVDEREFRALGGGPKEKKMRLAREIVTIYHGINAASEAETNFMKMFSQKELPADLPEVVIDDHGLTLIELLLKAHLAESKSEARRLIEQGGVKVKEVKKTDPNEMVIIETGLVIQVGPRRFVKIIRR